MQLGWRRWRFALVQLTVLTLGCGGGGAGGDAPSDMAVGDGATGDVADADGDAAGGDGGDGAAADLGEHDGDAPDALASDDGVDATGVDATGDGDDAPDAVAGDDGVDAAGDDATGDSADATGDSDDATGDSADASADSGDAATDADGATAGLPFEGTVITAPTDPTTYPKAALTDVTAALGIDAQVTHSLCVAAGDLDGDGRDDIVVTERSKKSARLHALLLGGAPGATTVQHVYTDFDTTVLNPTSACVLVDFTDDGHLDLLVGGQSGLGLYKGNGKGAFVDASAEWLPYILDFSTWSVVPVDLDGDGDLDLFVGTGSPSFDAGNPGPGPACGTQACGYLGEEFWCGLTTKIPNIAELQNRVMMRSSSPPLIDATAKWKVPGGGLLSAPVVLDADLDGKWDVVVSDDFGVHYLLHNKGGHFDQLSVDVGLHPYGHGMGFGVIDANHDGLLDLFLADLGPSPLYVQTAPSAGLPVAWVDEGGPRGVYYATWSASSWSPLVADFNHDGEDDVFLGGALWTPPEKLAPVTSGCTKGLTLPYEGNPNIDVMLLGTKAGPFVPHHVPTGPYSHFMAISQVLVDVDNDGDLDVLQARPFPNLTSTIRIYRNDLPKLGGAVKVRLLGKPGNRDAIGARVRGKIGGKLRTRWLHGHGGFGGAWLRSASFGLGEAAELSDIEVRWPDGQVTQHGNAKAGASLQLQWP